MSARLALLGLAGFAGFGFAVNAAQAASGDGYVVTNAVAIPPRSLGAYMAAVPKAPAGCNMRWPVIAGISAIESGHGTFSGDGVDRSAGPLPDGKAVAPIIGPALDGGEFALIWDTDGGKLDGDTVYDRAVGFTQAIPETWRRVMVDYPTADPQDVDDAAVFTALEVCRAAGGSINAPGAIDRALWAYNQDSSYVAEVKARIAGYDASGPQGAPTAVSASGDPTLDDVVDLTRSKLDRIWTDVETKTEKDNVVMAWLRKPMNLVLGRGGGKPSNSVGAVPGAKHALPLKGLTEADINTTHHDYPAWDLGIDEGTPIAATVAGTVTVIDDPSGCGHGVRINGQDGYTWTSCHFSDVRVGTGDNVTAGTIIGMSGNTGRSTGPHLHLQVRDSAGELVCPQPALRAWLDGDVSAQPSGTGCTH